MNRIVRGLKNSSLKVNDYERRTTEKRIAKMMDTTTLFFMSNTVICFSVGYIYFSVFIDHVT